MKKTYENDTEADIIQVVSNERYYFDVIDENNSDVRRNTP